MKIIHNFIILSTHLNVAIEHNISSIQINFYPKKNNNYLHNDLKKNSKSNGHPVPTTYTNCIPTHIKLNKLLYLCSMWNSMKIGESMSNKIQIRIIFANPYHHHLCSFMFANIYQTFRVSIKIGFFSSNFWVTRIFFCELNIKLSFFWAEIGKDTYLLVWHWFTRY